MGDDFWKPTAECFQQLFSKPKMTEKLLTRPPFRYIHDIFSATMGATGFGEGLYTDEELDAKSIKDKDAKVTFLDKMIALVQLAAGEEIPVKSTKVVAGHEAESTNIFLQYLFKVATSGIDSAPIVGQILGAEDADEAQQPDDDDQDDGDDDEAARQAEEEEARKREKRNAKKKAMEDQKAREAEDEAEKQQQLQQQQQEEEARNAAQREVKRKKKKEPEPQAPAAIPNIIEDGADEDDEDNIIADEQDDDEIGGAIGDVDPESKFGRQAMQQLRDAEEEDNQGINDDDGASGIKMGKIGRRGKKKGAGGVERSEPQKKALITDAVKSNYGGYSEEDIEFMRKAIQSLCQNVNPLGKSIEFLTEDIDSMKKEYEHWKLDYAESQTTLKEKQRITEETIQALQEVELAQIEEKIREEKSKIQTLRSQIIRNDNTTQNLLQSIISSG
jgi:TRAF3-interacting protein 1